MNEQNQGKGYEGRILLAFALTFIIIFAWSAYMRSTMPPPEEVPTETAEAPPREQPAPAVPSATEARSETRPGRPASAALGARQGDAERLITVRSDKAEVVFSTRGAVVRSWALREHLDAEGEPLELVHGDDTALGFPLEIQLDDPALQEKLSSAVYLLSTGQLSQAAPAELVFEWSDGELAARKRIAFLNGYVVNVESEVWRNGEPVPHRLRWGGGFGDLHAASAGFEPAFLLRKSDGLQRPSVRAATETTGWIWKAPPQIPPFTGPAAYAGLEDRYFAVLMIPESPALNVIVDANEWVPQLEHSGGEKNSEEAARLDSSDATDEKDAEADEAKVQLIGGISIGAAGVPVNRFRMYVGPKDINELQKIEVEPAAGAEPITLEDELVDFGWFWWVAKPLLAAMHWIYANVVGNYGWAIILLTFVINLLMFPLKYKSSQQAWRMQKIQPQVKALQEKGKTYKATDPRKQQLQQEIMAIYRQHGVNPLGGCLPMLIQLPFFLGFYRVLWSSIDLRLAPWMLWVQDLSQPDPYYLLPIVMTGTMFLSTKMTPMTMADPAQQRMMRLMPLLFGFMFMGFPAGLVLYWLASNLVGIGQQWWINKRHQEFLEAEKRDAKRQKKQRRLERGEAKSGGKNGGKT